LDHLKRRKQMIASLLAMGQVSAVADNTITISFSSNGGTNKQVLEKAESKGIVEETMREFFKLPVRIEYRLDAAPAKTEPTTSRKPPPLPIDAADLLEHDPDLKRMVEGVNGEIISRRKIDDEQ